MRKYFIILLVSIWLGMPSTGHAQSIFDQLYLEQSMEPMDLVLEVNMDSILTKRVQPQRGAVRFVDVDGRQHHWDVKVEIRGKFRRNRCDYPPLKLDFDKKDLKARGLLTYDKYKLVSPCNDAPGADALILKEYLAYKAYGMVTPFSFRVQLLNITYKDISKTHPDRTVISFLIEETDEMAARIGGKELDNALGLPADRFHKEAEATHALFQYMISNGDWSLPLARNVKIVERPDGLLIPVGYDFDFSGWVGAPYASPTSEIGQQSIYQRVYQGYFQEDELMRTVADVFAAQRKGIVSLVNKADGLSELEREVLWRFTTRFFRSLQNMNKEEGIQLYNQLRGVTADIIPPGATEDAYRQVGK
ncbi:hypothetical protein [Lewinella sp. W8]|uniref:hypothetical protein n=1 Tax=Lewinella sp. W8 TaxID=2528208 RepID=UPI00106823EF|nr:hypothetical protein [Lewinella sp. W8]MTB52982.1 hypothetical protein [Lewinella sp. W8]